MGLDMMGERLNQPSLAVETDGARSQGMGAAFNWKRQETGLSFRASGRNTVLQTL